MCGITGKISKVVIRTHDVKIALQAINHRGPDATGYWQSADRTKYIGSTRLAIQDLSPSGQMPMHSSDNLVHIVMNGEVYNFKEIRNELLGLGYIFYSDSDTEVVLNAYLAWGVHSFDRLNGMYAIAIIDERENSLILVRDRAGEKPLYCYHTHDLFAFASELKVLLNDEAVPNKLNHFALAEYLQYGYVASNHSLLSGVWQLKPGTYLELALDNLQYRQHTYWHLPEFTLEEYHAEQDYVNELERLLTQSIEGQLVADVPVGVFLSGGVDSSIVTGIASKVAQQPIKTFHISMKDAPNIDEQKYADVIAKHFRTDHTVLAAEALTFGKFMSILDTIDEPMADSSYIPTFMVAELAKQHVTVALGGDGGDELFGGYHHYQHLSSIAENTSYSWQSTITKRLPLGIKGRNYILSRDLDNYTYGFKNFFDDNHLAEILHLDVQNMIIPYQKASYIGSDILQAATRHDFHNYMTDDILAKVDRAAMANSLETRAPFLDRCVVEFAFGKVPSELKIKGSTKKYLLKALAKQLLPKDFPIERKQGFSIPLAQWMTGKWKGSVLEMIDELPSNIINKKELLRLLDREGRFFKNSHRIYAVFLLMVWMHKYKVEV
ncbi:MAG: asparagine synthase (glutamine-hydrolyzing) [Saprospiraceae bacterium]